MKCILYILAFYLVIVNSDDLSEKSLVTLPLYDSIVQRFMQFSMRLYPVLSTIIEFCEHGKELTLCPDPKCPIRTCDNTFTGTPDCFSINLPFMNPNCSWLTCRCPPSKVLNKELKCVNINDCVKCKEHESAVCPGYKCPPRTCANRDNPNVCQWDRSYLPQCYQKLQCACANGFFYDTPQRKCVAPQDCTKYWWEPTNGRDASELKGVAVDIGNDKQGNAIWVAKVWGYPGKVLTGNNSAYYCKNDKQTSACGIDIMCALPGALEWINYKPDVGIPRNAIIGGADELNRPLYIGMTNIDGENSSGRVIEGVLHFPYANKDNTAEEFQVLCEKEDLYL